MTKGLLNIFRLFFFPTAAEVDRVYEKFEPFIDRVLTALKLKKLEKIIHASTVIYFLVGCYTTFVNLGIYYALYFICFKPADDSFLIQAINGVAWFIAVVACFLPNKFYVFRAPYTDFKATFKEFCSFVLSRLATLIIETIGIFLFCTLLHMSALVVKPLLAIVVIILNYVFAKLWVFAKKAVQ